MCLRFWRKCLIREADDILISFLSLLVLYYYGSRPPMVVLRRYNPQDEEFLRSVVVPEEDRHRFTSTHWRGEYRWFRSSNIVPIEHWRRVEREQEEAVA
jgi:hypothetical protein